MLQYLTKHLLLNPLALSGDGQFLASWLLFCTFFSYCRRQNNSLPHMALHQSSLDITLCKVHKDLLPYKSSQLHEIGCHTHLSAIPKERKRDREEKKISKKDIWLLLHHIQQQLCKTHTHALYILRAVCKEKHTHTDHMQEQFAMQNI